MITRFGTRQPPFVARRPGTCPKCSTPFPEGTMIMFGRYRSPIHFECPVEEGSVNTTNPTER